MGNVQGTSGYLDDAVFKTVVANVPLVSIDLIVRDEEGRILLGKRVNKPARGMWFSMGGRVMKNEAIADAIRRISQTELGVEPASKPAFLGVFEHFYDEGIFEGVSTHYVNLGYEIEVKTLPSLPKEQHSQYRWFTPDELMRSDAVHQYVKDYFTTQPGSVPQNKEEK